MNNIYHYLRKKKKHQNETFGNSPSGKPAADPPGVILLNLFLGQLHTRTQQQRRTYTENNVTLRLCVCGG